MYKSDWSLNNLHYLICYKTKPSQNKTNKKYLRKLHSWTVYNYECVKYDVC